MASGNPERAHHFVLVHGAWHGAWCWAKLAPELEKAGHRVTAVDLLGAGENTEAEAEDITSPEEYDSPLERILSSLPDVDKVILVGHSLGGFTIGRMSEKFPDKISAAVYLAGVMPLKDHQELEKMKADQDSVFKKLVFEPGTGTGEVSPPKAMTPPAWFLEEFLYNKCSSEDFAFAKERVRPLAMVCNLPPSNLTDERFGRVPRVCVIARDDRAVRPASARRMAELSPPTEVFEIDGDHSAFLSSIPSTVDILLATAAKYDRLGYQGK